MIREIGFDTKAYLTAQINEILDRVSLFDKLYLEFGGKLCYDHHASRVLPGFDVDTKVRMLRQMEDQIEIILCVSAKDIEERKIPPDIILDAIKKRTAQRPPDVGKIAEEAFEVTEYALVYTPVFEARCRRLKTGEIKIIPISGVTGDMLSL